MEYPDVPPRSISGSGTPSSFRRNTNTSNDDSNNSRPSSPVPIEEHRPASPDLPLTMTASTILTSLPPDATSALASVGDFDRTHSSDAPPQQQSPAQRWMQSRQSQVLRGSSGLEQSQLLQRPSQQQPPETEKDQSQDIKVIIRFKAVGSAPQLKREVRKISAAQKFEAVVSHLRKALRVGMTEGLFLYVNSAFAPALDEVVGNLHRCFKDSNDQLIVAYSITPAFG